MTPIVAFCNFVNASKNSGRYDVLSFVAEEYVKAERMPKHDFILEYLIFLSTN
jgi:hypothetical protein